MDYSWVLSTWQVLLTWIYHLSVITCEYYMHDRIHLRVLHAQQDSLTSIQLLLASTKLHDRSYLRVFSTRQQSLASSVLLVSHGLNTRVVFKISQIMTRHSCFFVNLDVSCTVFCLAMDSFTKCESFCKDAIFHKMIMLCVHETYNSVIKS